MRQLSLTYGGGKTHTLITLYHLFNVQVQLPDLPAVSEFRQPHRRRVAVVCVAVIPFDNLDPKRGMEVQDPQGKMTLRYPWLVLAYQIAGDAGLQLIGGSDEER